MNYVNGSKGGNVDYERLDFWIRSKKEIGGAVAFGHQFIGSYENNNFVS